MGKEKLILDVAVRALADKAAAKDSEQHQQKLTVNKAIFQ